jgi:uncharacterized protein YecT (DUF1311 family)
MKPHLGFTISFLASTIVTATFAAPSPPPSRIEPKADLVNGIAIRADVERLSYISPRYLGIRAAYDACITETLGVVPKQQDCADAEYTYQDGRLNRDYKTLLATLEHDDRQAAIEAQRAWLRFRDKDCAARAGRFGSDAGPTTQSTCLMESTAHRAQQLEDWTNTVKRHPAR